MSDEVLYNKISKGLSDICDRQKIERVKKFYLIVNNDCGITPESLREHLKEELPDYVVPDTSIVLEKRNIAIFSAIIYKVEGED